MTDLPNDGPHKPGAHGAGAAVGRNSGFGRGVVHARGFGPDEAGDGAGAPASMAARTFRGRPAPAPNRATLSGGARDPEK